MTILSDLQASVINQIEATETGFQPQPDLIKLLSWLVLINGGGVGGGGGTSQQTIQDAIDAATILGSLETLLTSIDTNTASGGGTSQATIQDAIDAATLNATLSTISGKILSQSSTQTAVANAVNGSTLLYSLLDAFGTVEVLGSGAAEYSPTGQGYPRWTVPNGEEWTFLNAYWLFTTLAVEGTGNRVISLSFTAPAGWVSRNCALVSQPISTLYYYQAGTYKTTEILSPIANNLPINIQVPQVTLPAAATVQMIAEGIQSGDSFSGQTITIRRRLL
ncbi:MAG TPA: hypothetical protein V6C65_04495 [Allocoleopsis sp.]